MLLAKVQEAMTANILELGYSQLDNEIPEIKSNSSSSDGDEDDETVPLVADL